MQYENYPSYRDYGSSFYYTDTYPKEIPESTGCSHGRATKNFADPLYTCASCGKVNLTLHELTQ